MPMKPSAGEEQNAFMQRCMSETATDDRPKEQAVAICMNYWRAAHPSEKPPPEKQFGPEDDESHDDFIERCTADGGSEDECELAWEERKAPAVIHKAHEFDSDRGDGIYSERCHA